MWRHLVDQKPAPLAAANNTALNEPIA